MAPKKNLIRQSRVYHSSIKTEKKELTPTGARKKAHLYAERLQCREKTNSADIWGVGVEDSKTRENQGLGGARRSSYSL